VFVTPNFARQIVEIEAGLRKPVIFVGDLKPRRDYSDVRDIGPGLLDAPRARRARRSVNLCSGRSWASQQVLDFYVKQSHTKGIAVEIDPERLRPPT
jgi:GDP-4-dehydro-6-deoxy-D-mannose reductase